MFFSKFKGVKVPANKEMSLDGGVSEFLNPKEVYLTISNFMNFSDFELLVKEGDKVTIGQVIAKSTKGFESQVHSTCSGIVTRITEAMHSTGRMVPTVVVENDFKNTLHKDCVEDPNTDSLGSNDIVERIKRWGVIGRGGSGFPTFVKYNNVKNIETVILNAVECEPFITTDYVLMKEEMPRVIRGLRYLMKASNARYGKIAIKKGKRALAQAIESEIFNCNDIEIVWMEDKYPAGWEKAIVRTVTGKNYDRLPAEVGCIVNNPSTAYDVCVAVEDNQPLTVKYVTVAGPAMAKPQNVKVRVGSLASEILKGQLPEETTTLLVAGGPMTGGAMPHTDFVITRRNNAILAFEKKEEKFVDSISNACLRCGKCSDACPTNLTPALIKEAVDAKDDATMKKLGVLNCVACGICSYVCPSNIELTPNMKVAKAIAMKM